MKGLDGLSNAIFSVISGTESLGKAFGNLAKSIIGDIVQMTIKMLIFRAMSGLFKGVFGGGGGDLGLASVGVSDPFGGGNILPPVPLPQFAGGGSFSVLGNRGQDNNMLSINGLPIARISRGEQVMVSPEQSGIGGGGGHTFQIVPSPYFDVVVDGRASGVAAPMAARGAVAGAVGAQQAIALRQRRMFP